MRWEEKITAKSRKKKLCDTYILKWPVDYGSLVGDRLECLKIGSEWDTRKDLVEAEGAVDKWNRIIENSFFFKFEHFNIIGAGYVIRIVDYWNWHCSAKISINSRFCRHGSISCWALHFIFNTSCFMWKVCASLICYCTQILMWHECSYCSQSFKRIFPVRDV